MDEVTIKIISNPYTNKITFEQFDKGSWQSINTENYSSSNLLKSDIVEGFFPFKAEQIVDILIKEFWIQGQGFHLLFEGSQDEYEELCAVCELVSDPNINVEYSIRSLPNARDVLPEIIDIFKYIRPLVNEVAAEENGLAQDLEKFYDVSQDVIPLCVLGNYSAGKSTFINALIGQELLPNGDIPVTSKVFQIKRSKQQDRGTIKFTCNNERINLKFNELGLMDGHELPEAGFIGDIKTALLSSNLAAISGVSPMIAAMNKALKLINDKRTIEKSNNCSNDSCDNRNKDDLSIDNYGHDVVSDFIEIEVPFCMNDPWINSGEFVIFDTPGSNSASNEDHARVLSEAMNGLSNGLPIYVAAYDTLDSTDNEKLYDEIRQIDAMDERFAMIIVNKADAAALPKNAFSDSEKLDVMDSAIPRNLYAQGIYFVSSILSLGSKIDGNFMSDLYAEKYEDQVRKYSDPSNRFYKMLYQYNILPRQIAGRTIAESKNCPNLVFANSGLYCVEREIELYAKRYSAYNKCHLSEILLSKIIDVTTHEILDAKKDLEDERQKCLDEFSERKQKLIDDLREAKDKAKLETQENYSPCMDRVVDMDDYKLSKEQLEEYENRFISLNKDKFSYNQKKQNISDSFKSAGEILVTRTREALNSDDGLTVMTEALHTAKTNLDDIFEKQDEVKELKRSVDQKTSDDLIASVRELYAQRFKTIELSLNDSSESYLSKRAEEARNILYKIALNTTVLLEDEQKEIVDLIVNYPELCFDIDANDLFVKNDFEKKLIFADVELVRFAGLNLYKLSRSFNDKIMTGAKSFQEAIELSHGASYENWLETLLNKIIENISSYNPDLSKRVVKLEEDQQRINKLSQKLVDLENCTKHVSRLIDWRLM